VSDDKKVNFVSLCKAEPLGEYEVQNVELRIQDRMPTFSIALGCDVERDAFFDQQAEALLGALTSSLPGGTMDALLIRMLRRMVDRLSIPWAGEKESQVP
jgi:hypothetical protein